MQDNYVVIGNPIKHSLSPKIHAYFARQTGENIAYSTLLVEENNLNLQVKDFFAQPQNKGMNVTIPHKQSVFALCDRVTKPAQIAGAINTIAKDEQGQLVGYNTDGIGLVADLKSLNLPVSDKSLLIMGAGGATRGILAPLLEAGVKQIFISNRSGEKTQQIIADFAFSDKLFFLDWQYLLTNSSKIPHIDAVINATSMSMESSFPELNCNIFNEQLNWCYDLFYAKDSTSFLKFCKTKGVVNLHQGLGMLVEQAAQAFFIWRKVLPATKEIKKILAS